jgi:hypothetical protein
MAKVHTVSLTSEAFLSPLPFMSNQVPNAIEFRLSVVVEHLYGTKFRGEPQVWS